MMRWAVVLMFAFLCGCASRAPKMSVIGNQADERAVRRSIQLGVERAVVHPDQRIMPVSRIELHEAPFDVAFEIVWLEFGSEPLGVIWARRGEDSTFQPVRMALPLNYPAHQSLAMPAWPPRELRTVDVLLRPSQLAMEHAGMTDAWTGSIVIDDVPLEWTSISPSAHRTRCTPARRLDSQCSGLGR